MPEHTSRSNPEPSFVPASFIPSSSGTLPPRHPESSFILASNFCACLRPGALGILLSFAPTLTPSLSHPSPYPSSLFWHSARLAPSSPTGKTPTCYRRTWRKRRRRRASKNCSVPIKMDDLLSPWLLAVQRANLCVLVNLNISLPANHSELVNILNGVQVFELRHSRW